MNPLDVPDDATLGGTLHVGSPSVKGEGLKIKYWTGSMPGKKGQRCAMDFFLLYATQLNKCVFELMVSYFSDSYSMATTMNCLPISTIYYSDSSSLMFRLVDLLKVVCIL